MATRLGTEDYIYEELADWAQLPEGWSFKEVADVVVDAQDRVYVFNRGEHPMIIFEQDGSFVASWGEDLFSRAPRCNRRSRWNAVLRGRRRSFNPEMYPQWRSLDDYRHTR